MRQKSVPSETAEQHVREIRRATRKRYVEDELDTSSETLNEQLRLHVQRGLGYLSGRKIRSITDLVSITALAA